MRRPLCTLVLLLACLSLALNAVQAQNACSRASEAGQPSAQIDLWTECIEKVNLDQQSLAAAYSNRGNAKREAGDLAGAIADFSKAIELQGDSATLYYNRALALGSDGQPEKALADFSRALELDPELVDAYFNRGLIRYNHGKYQEAAADFSEVLRLRPNHAKAYANRAFARRDLGRLQEAREDARIARNLDPGVLVPEFSE